MIKSIISRLTMVKDGTSFYDNIGRQVVYTWQDCYFDKYLASSRFGFRVKKS